MISGAFLFIQLKVKKVRNMTIERKISCIFGGAFLLGFLWRLRGTHGWGAAWGLLAAGFVFSLFLMAILFDRSKRSFPLLAATAFSFMLTTPAWGTLLEQITGILTLRSNASDATLSVRIHPASGIVLMLCLGFGLASVFGVMLGNQFSQTTWRLRDYAVVLVMFYVTGLAMKAYPAHAILSLLQPQSCAAFAAELQKSGLPHSESVLAFYYAHFGNIPAAKGILGGRHYFSAVETIAFAAQASAVLLTTRFIVRDKQAAKTGAVVCGSFALSITVSDLFFFFANGGYLQQQGFSLSDWIAPWSMWEYCTGFLAGGIITAYLLLASKPAEGTAALCDKGRIHVTSKVTFVLSFVLVFVGAIGLNAVRPLLVRLDASAFQIPAVIAAAAVVLGACVYLCRRFGASLEKANASSTSCVLCTAFVAWFLCLYMLIGRPELHSMQTLHNLLVLLSAVYVELLLCFGAAKQKQSA